MCGVKLYGPFQFYAPIHIYAQIHLYARFDLYSLILKRYFEENRLAVDYNKKLGSRINVFSREQEEGLVARILYLENRVFGHTNTDQIFLAVKNNITHPLATKNLK